MTVYERDPNQAPDSDFEAGQLHHLVVGNAGRLMDARRTPLHIVGVQAETGTFDVRIDAFEDAGAVWQITFENVTTHCQFALGAERLPADTVKTFEEIAARLDRPLEIPRDTAKTDHTWSRVAAERQVADAWLETHSQFFASDASLPEPATREGHALLYADLQSYMQHRDLLDVEERFARQFVSNPDSGECIKGHRIVLAELGLVDFIGKAIRTPDIFEGAWSREQRAAHIVVRLGFVQALFDRCERQELLLYRGFSTEETIVPPRNHTFVSTTFDEQVARSHYDDYGPGANRLLMCQRVPLSRVFMTYLETAEMNAPFKEAEAVLLFDPDNPVF